MLPWERPRLEYHVGMMSNYSGKGACAAAVLMPLLLHLLPLLLLLLLLGWDYGDAHLLLLLLLLRWAYGDAQEEILAAGLGNSFVAWLVLLHHGMCSALVHPIKPFVRLASLRHTRKSVRKLRPTIVRASDQAMERTVERSSGRAIV